MQLDIDFVRQQFPAFSQANLKDQAFFENAGGSYACKQVIDRLHRFYTERKVQPYSNYDISRLGGEEMDEAQVRLAAILGVETDELSFGPSTTQNTYVLANAFGSWLKDGDAIIVTNQDHEANTGPWRRLADRGIKILEWQLNKDTGHLDINDLQKLFENQVKLVCFPHCSNVVGEINNVSKIVSLIQSFGAFACVDGVSYAPHGLPNVGKIGADIYMFSSYKTYGPHQGVMVIRRDLGEKLPNQGHYFNAKYLSKRFTPAGPDHAQIAACAGIADYIDTLHMHHGGISSASATERGEFVHDLMRAHETQIMPPLLEWATSKNSVRLLGPTEAELRAPTVALDIKQSPKKVANELALKGVMAGSGDFYAVRALEAHGIDADKGVLRLSYVHYTKPEEIEKLVDALDTII
ncbi:aminotransferase class V-fold PLP-dependent enzyme [Paracoccaceae bacterium]|nr:aminotransferase class V-fold PLP-dependent enzyme [Paracoccaceae bacterium]